MKYLCLIYDDESKFGTLPKEQMDTMMAEYGAFTEGIKKSGQYIGGEPLAADFTSATTVDESGKAVRFPRPMARYAGKPKEQLGGYQIPRSMRRIWNDAIQVASRIPSAKVGAIEVRPVMVFGQ